MKNNYKAKTLIAALMLISALSAFAQHDTIANPGFESWACPSYCNPNSWTTDNSLTDVPIVGSAVVFEETTPAHVHSGAASAELKTASVVGQIAPGTITNGWIDKTNEAIYDGAAINYRPLKFKGWYQFAPQSATDTFVASIAFYNGNTRTTAPIGTANLLTTTAQSAWTEWDLPIVYTGSAIPDSVQIIISSGTGNNSSSGTIAYVDDLSLVDCSLMSVSATPTAASCTQSNGSAVAASTGGTSPYTYAWSNSSTTSTISSLPAATYTVIATDAEGCSASTTAAVTTSNVPFTVTPANGTTTCVSNIGTVSVAASNGNSPYSYVWSNTSTTEQINNLGSGNYNVTVTDAHGCTTTASASVTTPGGPSATDAVTNVLCHGGSSGGIVVTETGGTGPIHYAWSNGATTTSLTGVVSGPYTLTITDNNSCSFEVSATISQPAALTASDSVTNIACFGASTGSILITDTGGTGTIAYTWSPGVSSTAGAAGLSSGPYTVTLTDANNCTLALSATITQPASAVSVTDTTTNVLCHGNSTGSVIVAAQGGTSPYTYAWTGGATTAAISNLAAGPYSVVVTDSNGCTVNQSISITQPTAVTASVSVVPATSSTAADGMASVVASGGAGGYTYAWSNSATGSSISDLTPATYCVTVSDLSSCTVTACDSVGFTTGIQSISPVSVEIYPNPASSQLTIEINSADGKFQFNVYSLDGRLVEQQIITGEKSTVMLSRFADGFYTYQLKDEVSGAINYGKFEIQR